MNLLSCYVKSQQREHLVDLVQRYSGCGSVIHNAAVPAAPETVLAAVNSPPSSYTINRYAEWTVIEVNSFMHLHDLGKLLSKQLQTIFLQAFYCVVVEYAYLLLYENGTLIREIEAKGCKEIPDRNFGQCLPFEQGEGMAFFDLDMIADYCQQLGIDISNQFAERTCTVVQDTLPAATSRLDHEKDMLHLIYPVR
ncbi:hypothetical protein [Paraflavitalea pollutisoli]|uniref:hypothetical protein n=1 Tax=Paraflavitalea pollutisoli TaxID=3034143 RepID=UPI0023ECE675|nr:hypothetical protein [Paraflavitalea sp. H1-2-19X]